MPQSRSLDDLDFLQELIDTPDPPKGYKSKKLKDVRDVITWFRLDHIVDKCLDCGSGFVERGYEGKDNDTIIGFTDRCMDCGSSNVAFSVGRCSQGENCIGLISQDKGPVRVTAIVNGIEMCRFCFLDGLAYVAPE